MVLVRRISMHDALKLAIFLTLVTFSSNVQDQDDAEVRNAESPVTTQSPTTIGSYSSPRKPMNEYRDYRRHCPSGAKCSVLGGDCLNCTFNSSCVYGEEVNVPCEPLAGIECLGEKIFNRSMVCQYCYQMDPTSYNCKLKANCNSVSSPRAYFQSNCTVKSEFLCMGNRVFLKNLPCNWTGGYKWSTALLLSITLGGFGADRFYLGHWQEAIGKLFSFGGLGVWTLVDVVLIWLHYLGPADGSLYI